MINEPDLFLVGGSCPHIGFKSCSLTKWLVAPNFKSGSRYVLEVISSEIVEGMY